MTLNTGYISRITICISMYIHIYIYIYTYMHTYIYIYTYIHPNYYMLKDLRLLTLPGSGLRIQLQLMDGYGQPQKPAIQGLGTPEASIEIVSSPADCARSTKPKPETLNPRPQTRIPKPETQINLLT